MVNFIEAQKPLLRRLMKMAGLRPVAVEIEAGTTVHVWAPKHRTTKKKPPTISPMEPNDRKPERRPRGRREAAEKPDVVLIHGFAAEGIVTWQFNFGVLVSRYNLYVPDLLFFGGSATAGGGRSPEFQAACVAAALGRLGVARCDVVGFSYGGMVAFKMAEARPELVRSVAVSGAVVAMTDAVNEETMRRLGARSSAELLMPETVEGLKALLSVSMYKRMWFPNRFYKDYLKVMFSHRKEKMELLEGLITSNMDAKIPTFQQKIMLIWGEEDQIFSIELAKKMREQLGANCMLQGIPKAGHLLHVERPCAYNRHLQRFLAYVHAQGDGADQGCVQVSRTD